MNVRLTALILGFTLVGLACSVPYDFLEAQTQTEAELTEAYRYGPLLRWIVANKMIFGDGIDNLRFLYAYDPSALNEYLRDGQGQERALEPLVLLRPIAGGAYAISRPEECSSGGSLETCAQQIAAMDGGLMATDTAFEGIESTGVFVVQDSPSAISANSSTLLRHETTDHLFPSE